MRCERCGREYPSHYYFKTDAVCLECFTGLGDAERLAVLQQALVEHPLASTTFTIEGYRVVRQIGVVRGLTVRSRSIFGTVGAALQTVVGGEITLFTELCERSRGEAFANMVAHAREAGANAIVGVRYDTTEVMDGVTEVLCYGTAVIVEPA
jgi:uncharacterized protein YbjQ (UPF0145 family)